MDLGEAMLLAMRLGAYPEAIAAMNLWATIELGRGQLAEAEEALDQALVLAQQSNDRRAEAKVQNTLGVVRGTGALRAASATEATAAFGMADAAFRRAQELQVARESGKLPPPEVLRGAPSLALYHDRPWLQKFLQLQ